MKSTLLAFAACLLAATLVSAYIDPEAPVSYKGHSVLRFSNLNGKQWAYVMDLVKELNLDVWSEPHPLKPHMDVRVNAAQLQYFRQMNIPYEVFIEDVGALMENEKRRAVQVQATGFGAEADDFFSTFRTYDEVRTYIEGLAAKYPNLATFVPSIGYTLQNRSIFAIEFGTNKSAPAIVMNAGIHAREWITVTSVDYFITHLLTGYGSDPVATELLNTYYWKIVPILNADGYEYTWKSDRMWRKNLRKVSSICTGVDCNRNFGYAWQSSPFCSETYPGDKAFSERESQAMADYVAASKNAISYVDVHSYSQLWMYPWGDKPNNVPDVKDLNQVSDAAVKAIASVEGTKFVYGSIYNTIYPVYGGSIDWTYANLKVKYSFGIECRDTGRYGFVQPPEAIVPAGKEMTAGFIAMAQEIKKIEKL